MITLFQGAPTTPISASTAPSVNWRRELSAYCYQRPNPAGGAWLNHPLTKPFLMDIFAAKQGWEVWRTTGDQHTREVVVGSISSPYPPSPPAADKPKEFFAVAIYSEETNGEAELVIKGGHARHFIDFIKSVAEIAAEAQAGDGLVVPVVNLSTTRADDFSLIPVFAASNWIDRPTSLGPAIVRFV